MSATPRDLTHWLEEGHHAVESGAPLTVDHLRALAATPETIGRDGKGRRTWWIEEAERVQREQIRDRMPTDGNARELWWWQLRQDHRSDQIESLLDAHAECLLHAAAPPLTQEPAVRPRKTTGKRRPSRVELASGATPAREDAA